MGEQFKVRQVVSEVIGDAYMMLVGMGEAKLAGTKEASTARDHSTQ